MKQDKKPLEVSILIFVSL